MDLTKAIFDRLQTISHLFDAYEGEDGPEPAIFSDTVPDDYVFEIGARPIAVIPAASADVDDSTYTEARRAVTREVRIYGRPRGSSLTVDNAASAVRDLFHVRPGEMTVSGGAVEVVTASGPTGAPTSDPALIGRRVVLRIEARKT